jgi:hypothetical protein
MNYGGLPEELWYKIVLDCTPTCLNALRKVCKPLWKIASKNNIPQLLAKPTSYSVTKDDKGNTVIKCLLKLTSNDLHDTVQAAESAKDQCTLDSLKTYFSNDPNIDTKQFVYKILTDGLIKRASLFNFWYNTLLQKDCALGHVEKLTTVLTHHYFPSEKISAARIAIQYGHFECMRTILLTTSEIDATLLRDAVIYNNAEAVEFLLSYRCALNPNQDVMWDTLKSPKSETLVHRAIRNKASGILQQLVRARAHMTKDYQRRTPLKLAQELLAQEPTEYQKTSEYQKIIDILLAAKL